MPPDMLATLGARVSAALDGIDAQKLEYSVSSVGRVKIHLLNHLYAHMVTALKK